jgi:mono/diheme cytochrome c family protein
MKKSKKINLLFVLTLMLGGSFLLSMTSIAQKPWPVPANYKSMKNAKAGVKDTENIGKTLYNQHCKSCHGVKGAGDGTKASGLSTEMRDFGIAAVQSQTDGELYYKSFIGRDEMPNFEKKITAVGDRWLVINYIRTMKK